MDFFGKREAADPAQVARIKAWTVDAFGLATDAPIMVIELRCSEPGCPPVETVIVLLGQPGGATQHKLHKAVAAVTADDIGRLAAAAAKAVSPTAPTSDR